MTKKRLIFILVGAAVLAMAAAVFLLRPGRGEAGGQGEELELFYFFDNPCLSCDDEGKFTEFFNQQTADIKGYRNYRLRIVNTFSDTSDALSPHLERLGLSAADYTGELFIAGNSWLMGTDIVQEGRLRQMVWREGGLGDQPEVLEYYFRDNCKDCQAIKETIESFFAAHPEIPIVRLDTNDLDTKAAFKELMAQLEIPGERIQIPYVIYKGTHYSGNAEIEAALASEFAS